MDERATTIEGVRSVGPDGIAVEVTTPEGFDALPGQFARMTATVDGEDVSSIYTISSPDVSGTFETTVAVDPDGDLSPWLADVEPGTPIRIEGPFGTSHYEGEPRTVVLCGGPGIGPGVAIAERTLADGGRTAIVYRDDGPLHTDRLAALRDAGATVHLIGADEPLGPATEEVVTGAADEQVFAYGFREFVDAARAVLDDVRLGREPKIENFG